LRFSKRQGLSEQIKKYRIVVAAFLQASKSLLMMTRIQIQCLRELAKEDEKESI
jgi:hypothetical protein